MSERRDSKMITAIRPAALARDKLSIALGLIQDIPDPPKAVETVTEFIAKSVAALFSVERSDPDDPAHVEGVKQAMSNISQALEKMQDIGVNGAAIDGATSALAATLAMLYPVAKSQERGPLPIETPAPMPIADYPGRKTRRVGVEADVGFQTESQFYTGFTQDISEGGLFLATYDIKDMGTEMSISFTLPDGHLVTCVGVVRWLREYNPTTPDVHPGMGLQFTELNNEDRTAIESFLTERPAMFYED